MITVQSRDRFLKAIAFLFPDNPYCVEIGVLEGQFSEMIVKELKPWPLVLIDPYKTNDVHYGKALSFCPTAYSTEDQYQNLIRKFEVDITFGVVLVERKFSYEAVSGFENNSIDFIYLDGDHTYEGVKRDLEDWVVKVKPSGIISGHDHIDFDNFGVKDAVTEFCDQYKYEMIIFNENGGDWALKTKQQ